MRLCDQPGGDRRRQEVKTLTPTPNLILCRLSRFQQAELVHGRTAMVGVAGILIPDVRSAAPQLAPPLA